MENPEEILHSLEEFSKSRPKDIPRELEDYLSFVAKTGDPIYQWSAIKSLFREKMISVITDFYETCPSVEIPPCPNVDLFNYDVMKNFILEKLDTFAAAPFTLQRICELLTSPKKEYNRIDKYMRALEKNILVVSTTEPRGRRSTENGEGIMNGLESEHLPEISNNSNDINVEEMDDPPTWPRLLQNEAAPFQNDSEASSEAPAEQVVQETVVTASKIPETACTSSQDTVICRNTEEPYVSIEPVPSTTCTRQDNTDETDVSVTITAIPAGVQKRRNSVEPVVSSETTEEISNSSDIAKEADAKLEEEAPSSNEVEVPASSEVEDADSSSSTEDEKDIKEEKPASPLNELSSTEGEDHKVVEEVTTSEVTTEDREEETKEVREEITVDTTKCSKPSSPPPESTTTSTDSEISSSDKVEEVHSSQSDPDVREEQNEAISVSSNVEDKVEESQTREEGGVEEKVGVFENEEAETAMEVDEVTL